MPICLYKIEVLVSALPVWLEQHEFRNSFCSKQKLLKMYRMNCIHIKSIGCVFSDCPVPYALTVTLLMCAECLAILL